ncbi:inositol monophosphatase family protein [Fuerstiella marisgermanici]|uniref:Inositol-1-monophosphatase n=1 Tax=Fuerstiella marisgermanici TaxID=1891926 RepID=A0A1P8WKR0_9PLAN|nr:inositol monophosphatase family protein [Fuerstiella marisgermanici]APZ94640.1 Inositol-1-monophosphatase [Fuerstiella marisgermanici]
MSIQQTAKEAATAAGDILSDYFHNGVTMRTKSASVDLVSDADVNAERAIAEVIRKHFPEHSILGEEENSDDVNTPHLWIVDPLDGTTNFAHGIPHFAVSIAYYRDGQADTGVIFNPILGDWYIADQTTGATHNGQSIHVGSQTRLDEVLIGTGFYYDRGAMMEATLASVDRLFKQQIHGIRRFGTASLDLAMVACGQFGAYFEYQLSPWDFAAGRLLVEAAGGKVTTCAGGPLPLQKTSLLASNGNLHDDVLNLVQR